MGCTSCKAAVGERPARALVLRNLKGEEITIHCKDTDLVSELQRLVGESIGKSPDTIKIIKGGAILQSDQALKNANITKTDILQYIVSESHNLNSEEQGPSLVYIKEGGSLRKIEVACAPEETVKSLKVKLEEEFKVKSENMTLLFNGAELADEEPLKSYNIHDCANLNIICDKKQSNVIHVTWKNKTKDFPYNVDDSVYNLKSKIAREFDLHSTENMELKHGGLTMKNEKTLKNYEVKPGDTLKVI